MRDKINITVTGSHGKTTTTSLISHLLMRGGFSPTVAIGGILRKLDNNISLGNGSYFVAEADESDGSFLCYSPYYSIITNIDYEHLDYYRNWNRIIKTFKEFIERTDRRGCLFGCGDDMRIKEILDNYKKRYIFFGLQEHNHIYPFAIETNGLSSEFNCRYNGKDIGRFRIPLAGRHNISNSLAVIALGLELGIKFNDIKDAIGSYSGVERRFQIKLKTDRLAIVDDYAHHPTEIKRTLEAARVWINSSQDRAYKRLVVVFQPHRYSRTQYLLNQFAPSFIDSDYLVITDIYPASEAPIRGVSAASICKNTGELLGNQRVIYLPKDEIKNFISKNIITGDLVIFMGAGDIAKIADEVAEYFKGQDKAQ
jgi:UDP-N-acetylmuramate--alanine ligase